MKKISTFLTTLALATSVGFAADAAKEGEKPKRDPEAMFKKLDANSDGKVTKEEYLASPMGKKDPARAEQSFGKRDKDGNGELNLEEFKSAGPKKEKAT